MTRYFLSDFILEWQPYFMPLWVFSLYMPCSVFLLAATGIRKYTLMLFGFAFALGLAGLFFYMIDGLEELYFSWLSDLLAFRKIYYVSFAQFLVIAAPFLGLFVLAALQMLGGDVRFIHYQVRCQQSVFLWLVFAGLCLLLAPELTPFQLIVLVPGVVFFGTHFFLIVSRDWMADVAFGVLLVAILFINFSNVYNFYAKPWVNLDNFVLAPATETNGIKNKKMLVAGENLTPYIHNTPATPYLQWKLAERHFNNLDDYVTVTEVYENFRKDMPDVIVDQQGKVALLFARVPALARFYTKDVNAPVYVRKNPGFTRK